MTNYEPIVPIIYSIKELIGLFDLEESPKAFERVDNLAIQCENYTLQLSVICYRRYIKDRRKPKNSIQKVNVVKSSLDQERILLCRGLLIFIHDRITNGMAIITLIAKLKPIVAFFKYLDINKIELYMEPTSISVALIQYSEHLIHKVKTYDRELKSGLSTNTAHSYQAGIVHLFSFVLQIESYKVLRSDYIIKRNYHQNIPSQALLPKNQEIEFNQYTQLFRRLSSIVFNHEMLPLTFDLNKEPYWITHSGKILHAGNEKLLRIWSFNFKENRDYSEDELISAGRFKYAYERNQSIKRLKEQKKQSNSHYSSSRLTMAFYACNAYFMHFLFLTGENDSTAASIIINSDYEIQNQKVCFKSIKWRANGKLVNYDIQSEFIDDFKKYLRLREYLINFYNKEPRELFLTRHKNTLSSPSTSGGYSYKIKNSFTKIFDKNDFNALSKNIRVSKALWIRKNYGGGVSSYILQHNKSTSDSNYTASNSETSSEELSDYFSELSKQMITTSEIKNKTQSGNCIEPGSPEISPINIPYEDDIPTCGEPNSCLFCKKYRVHADEVDIRKLFSIKYLITQSEHLANSTEHFNRIYKLTIERVDSLIEQISKMNKENINLIITIKNEVFEQENLSNYWYRKLELLDELGVL